MQTVPLAENAPARPALPMREATPVVADDAVESERFVPAATCLAVAVTVILIFFGRW